MDEAERNVSRRSFIKASAGVAAGSAAVAVPAAVVAGRGPNDVVKPSSPAPAEPVMAYVHDARRGEVTVLSGTSETTYRDPALAKRLLAAAEQQSTGGEDVIAP